MTDPSLIERLREFYALSTKHDELLKEEAADALDECLPYLKFIDKHEIMGEDEAVPALIRKIEGKP